MKGSPFLLIFLIHASHAVIYSSGNGKKDKSNSYLDGWEKPEDNTKLSPFLFPPPPPTFMFPPFFLFNKELTKKSDMEKKGSIIKREGEDDLHHLDKPAPSTLDAFQQLLKDQAVQTRKQVHHRFSVKVKGTTPTPPPKKKIKKERKPSVTPPAKPSPFWPFEKTLIFLILNSNKGEEKPKPIKKPTPTTSSPVHPPAMFSIEFGKPKANKNVEIRHHNTPKSYSFQTGRRPSLSLSFEDDDDISIPKRNANKQMELFHDMMTMTSGLSSGKQKQRGPSSFLSDQSGSSEHQHSQTLLGYPGEHYYGPAQQMEQHPIDTNDILFPSLKFNIPPPPPYNDNADFYWRSPSQRQPRSPIMEEEDSFMDMDYPFAFDDFLPLDDIMHEEDIGGPAPLPPRQLKMQVRHQQSYQIPLQQKPKTFPAANDIFY